MKKGIVAFLIVFALVTAVVLGIYSIKNPKPIVPNQAAVQSGTVNLTLDSGSGTTWSQGQTGTIYLKVAIPSGTSVDGFQVFATVSGTIPADLAFNPSTPAGTQMILNDFQKTGTTANLKLAFVTQNPQVPYTAANTTLGAFTFTAPATGQMTISFDNNLTKVVKNGNSQDILGIPTAGTYTFGVTSSASPSPTATAVPTATPTATPTSAPTSCTRGIQSVSLSPSSQSGYKGQALTYTVTVTNNDDRTCDKANFSLSAILPYSDWSVSFAQSVLSIAPQTSASTTVNFTSSLNSPYGTLPVGVNTVGPRAALVAAANYLVLQGTAPTSTAKPTPEVIYLKGGTNGSPLATASSTPLAVVEPTVEPVTTQSGPNGLLSKIPTAVIYAIGAFLLIVLFFILRALFSKGDNNNPPKMTPPTGTTTTVTSSPMQSGTSETPQISHSVEANPEPEPSQVEEEKPLDRTSFRKSIWNILTGSSSKK